MPDNAIDTRLAQRGRRRARKAGLEYVNDFDSGWSRRRCGRGFTYLSVTGRTLRSKRTRKRIEALAIPPAWEDVWINPRASGHIQATGRDESGRKQYIYHPAWKAISQATKYDRLPLLAELLPRIRRRARRDLNRDALSKPRVLAAVTRLIDRGNVRVGNERYTDRHGSHGATTLTADQVDVDDFRISLEYPGKSGKARDVSISDRKAAQVIRQCEEIDSQFLFCYRDREGGVHTVHSSDVNDYLRDAAGQSVTAKDFRTWWGSVEALASLDGAIADDRYAGRRTAAVNDAVAVAAGHLGNSKAVCRRSYIHPGLIAAGKSGEFADIIRRARQRMPDDRVAEMTQDEVLFATVLPMLNA